MTLLMVHTYNGVASVKAGGVGHFRAGYRTESVDGGGNSACDGNGTGNGATGNFAIEGEGYSSRG